MNITIVMGFFLPMPPVAGGATEKSWDGLAREFAKRGHAVTVISRRWTGWPDFERKDGVNYLRLRGYSHTGRLLQNLWRDLCWSWRVWKALPPADITVVNSVTLPIWLGWFRRQAGRLIIMPGRMPKGQYRWYRRVNRVIVVSSPVGDALLSENPGLASVSKIFGYPIAWQRLAAARTPCPEVITLGYVGRIHIEKGLVLLVAAVAELARRPHLRPWRLLVCGPTDIARGGSGPEFAASLERSLDAALPPERFSFRPPVFDADELARVYGEIDIFCYPSLAAHGETFGVAVAEAMAAGAVPVVSRLPCFLDFVRDGINGAVFAHDLPDAAEALADTLEKLVQNPDQRLHLAQQAQADVRTYDFPVFAEKLLEDFSALK
jgi:glycosyltransferase involved in cell wall biosynthesis